MPLVVAVAPAGATPHQEPEPAPPDMRNIRCPREGVYVVRVNVGGVQEHVGTFLTHAQAVAARDARLARKVAPPVAAPIEKACAVAAAAAAAAPKAKKTKGVYARQTTTGIVYDVLAYKNGMYCWGGRYTTREAAEEARARIQPSVVQQARMTEARQWVRNEPGVTVRFNKRCDPVYIARVHCRGCHHVGTYATLDDARDAIAQYRASLL